MSKLIENDIKELKKIMDWIISEMDNPKLTEGALLELSQRLDVLICMFHKDNSL
jgi:hypothetical protein